jgi:uncharacterized repeat protein (TIGR01451 family)
MKNRFTPSIFLITIFCSVLFYTKTNAQSITPFSIWKQVTQKGDITFTGNSMLTCAASGTCTTALGAISPIGSGAGNNYNNNGFVMNYINIADATDPTARFSRSNANLTLGTTGGCGVIYAELFWGGSISAATTNYAKRDSVYLKVPGGGYVGLKADIRTDAASPFAGYYCYKDVTALVKAGGTGTYWLANQVLQNNPAITGLCGGWSLVVIYSDPVLPLRNLSIFRGIAGINGTNPQNITINGFFTPPSPALVNLKLGVFSLEGDRGTAGDSLKFNGNAAFGFLSVFNTKNETDNAFNSTITNNLAEIVRSPNNPNTLGIDQDIFVPNNATYNFLTNGATTATLRMTSSGDVYAPFMISTAIDVFEPSIEIYKDVLDINGGLVEMGDTLTYTLKVVNKGNDPATNTVLYDSLYGAMNYVPNSMKILTGANAGVKTDGTGDDQGSFALVGGVNFVRFNLGNLANATTGGAMGISAATDSVTTMEFKATVTTDCQIFHCNSNLVNKAYVTFVGNLSGQGRSTYSSPTGFDAYGCPALGPTTLVVNVPPCTPVADTSVSGCSPYSLANVSPNRPGYTQFFNSGFTSVTNATSSGTYYAIKQLYTGCSDTIQINMNINCVLPILLTNFKALYQNKMVQLFWSTQQEINNKEFVLERSVDGIYFETIAIVPGAINSQSSKSYSYDDMAFPHISKIYFRLSQVDIDGSKHNAAIQTVYVKDYQNINLSIYSIVPNPVKEMATVTIIADVENNYTLSLYNGLGQRINATQKHLSKGQNTASINLSNVEKGFYILEVQNNTTLQKVVHKLIKE